MSGPVSDGSALGALKWVCHSASCQLDTRTPEKSLSTVTFPQ